MTPFPPPGRPASSCIGALVLPTSGRLAVRRLDPPRRLLERPRLEVDLQPVAVSVSVVRGATR